MTGTTRSNNPWIKEQAEFFESVTTKELNVLNELGNEHLKWFSECTTISQILAWGEKNQTETVNTVNEREKHISETGESKSAATTEICKKNIGITPEDFVATETSPNKPVSLEDSETEASGFLGVVSTNEIGDIAEEREIQLSPELDSILNYDPKEAGDIGDTVEMVKDVDTPTELQNSLKKSDQVVKNEIKSGIDKEVEEDTTKFFTQTGHNKSLTNISLIMSEKTNVSNLLKKKQQHDDTGPIQYNDESPSQSNNNLKSENENIPTHESKVTAESNPIPVKPIITMNLQHQNMSVAPIETSTKESVVINSIEKEIAKTTLNYNHSGTVKNNEETDPDKKSGLENLNSNNTVFEHTSGQTNAKETRNLSVETSPIIGVSEVMPEQPFRKKLRVANPQKTPVQEHKEVQSMEIQQETEKESVKPKSRIPLWATEPELSKHLKNQEPMDPDSIFGPCAPVDIYEIFK